MSLASRILLTMSQNSYKPDDVFVSSTEEAKGVQSHLELRTSADERGGALLETAVPRELNGDHLLFVIGDRATGNA